MKKFKSRITFSILIVVLIGIFFVSYNFLTNNKFNNKLKYDNSNIKDPAAPRIDDPIELGDNEEELKKKIINLPTNTKYVGFETEPDTATKGDKTVNLNVVFNDNTYKKYTLNYKVYEVKWVKPKIEADVKTQTVRDGDTINNVTWTAENISNSYDHTNYVINKVNPMLANYILNPHTLVYDSFTAPGGQGTLRAKININWRNNEEEQRVIEIVNYTAYEQNYDFTESKTKLIVNRDTDNDGRIDSEDDDDDDDGFTDEQEKLYGSNPKDAKSKPNQAALYKINVLQKKPLKYYVNDTPNVLDAITSDKALNNVNKIKKITVKQDITTDQKGEKIAKVEFEFEDCSTLEVEVIAKVFEKEIVAPKLLVSRDSQEVIEGKTIQDVIFNRESVDTAGSEYVDKKIDDVINQTLTFKSSLLPISPSATVKENTQAKDYSSPVNANTMYPTSTVYSNAQWGNNERATFVLEGEIEYKTKGTVKKQSIITLLRDTDKDGTPDETDDDDDGDGVSDEDEKNKYHTDPKDSTSKPTEAELHGNEVTTKEFTIYENDPINILDGITLMPSGATKKIIKNVDNTTKGLKEGEVEVTFKDNSKKTYKIKVKVYKKVYVRPKLVVKENANNEVVEGKSIQTIKFGLEEPTNLGKDNEQYIERIRDNPTLSGATSSTEDLDKLVTGLNSDLNPNVSIDVSGKPIINWLTDNTKERIQVNLKATLTSDHDPTPEEVTTSFTVLRDTDKDGTADEIDDDDDGDGVSDEDERRTGHNPKNPADKPTKAELDNTIINTKVLRTYVNEPIDLKEGLINQPFNTTLELGSNADFSTKGSTSGTVKVKYSDGSFKTVKVNVNVFEKRYIKPNVTATPSTQNVIESKNITEVALNKSTVNGSIDNENYIEYIVDNVVSEGFDNLNGLTFDNNQLKGKLNLTWANNNEENKTVTLTHKIKYQHLPDTDTTVKFNVDRDTDGDGIKDSEDDDDDGDGFTDQEEKDNNSDPKDSSSIPSQADIYKLRHLKTKKLRAYVGDTVDIKQGITSPLTGHNIEKLSIFKNTNTSVKGDDKPGTVRITFKDSSHLDVEIFTDVYEKQYIKGNLIASPDNQTAIEKKHINQVIFQVNKVNENIDEDNNIEYIPDEIESNTVETQNATNLAVTDISNTLTIGKLVTGIPNITWPNNIDEEKTITVTNKIKYKHLGTDEKTVNIKILRDTDGDSTPDKLDEDDDDDGYTDDEEKAAGTDPKDPTSKPNNATTGKVITQILKGYVGDNLDEKLAIKSKPENGTLEVIKEFDTTSKGQKEGTVRVKYPDNSFKDYKVLANIYEKQYLIHDVSVENDNQRVTEGKNITPINVNKTLNGTPGIDTDQYIEKMVDPLNNENYDKLYNLTNSSNVLSGKVKIADWQEKEETRNITINYTRDYLHHGSLTTPIHLTVDRDTDNDEIPDKDDDDDDGDGVSDADEKRTGHDPKNPADKPTKAELDNTVININNGLETMVNKPIDITTAVINKPAGTTVHIKTPVDFSTKGPKTGVVEIRYSDGSKKEYNVPVKVYDLEYVKPSVTVTNSNTNVLEGKPIQNIKFNKTAPDLTTDEINFIKKKLDQTVSEDINITGANINKSTDEVNGIPTVNWVGQEESKTVVVKKVITYEHLPKTEVSTVFTIDRDTDNDGTADKDDDDDDGDGVSDADEIKTGHDPKDPTDKPTKAELDESLITKQTLEAYVGDNVDITTGITNKPANTTLEVVTPVTTTSKGLKQGIVKVKYPDGSFKNVTIDVKIYQKEYVKPIINVNNSNSPIIDKHAIQDITFTKVNPEVGKNDITYVEKILDTETTNTVSNLNGLTYSADKISGNVTVNWIGQEESKTITLTNTRTYAHLPSTTTTTSIVVNRDTDNDGTIDSEDDDDDGDGISDADETRTGHDPKNPADKPTQSELDHANIVSNVLNVEVNDPVDITTAITNKPAGTTVRVKTPVSTTIKGQKTGVVEIVYPDNSVKEVPVKVNVYEVKYLVPNVTVTNPNTEVIEPDNIKDVNINVSEVNERVDEVNFIKYKKDELLSETITNLNGLTNDSNRKLSGKFNYIFTGNEETKVIDMPYTRVYRHNPPTVKNIKIKLLRDTDKDKIPDIRDDDKDGDGYSNAIEIAKGSDPYDPNSVPSLTKKEQLDELIKKLEKLIDDTKKNPYDNKNKTDVDHLKNETLPDKENKKNDIKNSYNNSTPDSEIEKKKKEVQKHIDDINKEINKLRDKANFEELDKEKAKPIEEDLYTPETVKPLKDKIEEANKMNRDTSTQQEVDDMTRIIKDLRDKLELDKKKLKDKIDELDKKIDDGKCLSEECKKTSEKAKNGYNNPNLTKDEYVQLINEINAVLQKNDNIKNPRTSSSQFIIVIIASLILVVGYIMLKTKKSYLR